MAEADTFVEDCMIYDDSSIRLVIQYVNEQLSANTQHNQSTHKINL